MDKSKIIPGAINSKVGINDKFYWFFLTNIPGIGNGKIEKLLDIFKTPKNIHDALTKDLLEARYPKYAEDNDKTTMQNILTAKDVESLDRVRKEGNLYLRYKELEKSHIQMITLFDEIYPKRLRNIPDRPVCLYLKGKLPDENKPSVAIVGARNCTEYGRSVAFDIGKVLGMCDVNVISGMARGIDRAAHEGALDANGYTMAVLACDVDICYPRENIEIYTRMIESGGIISEYPPGTKPLNRHFPLRNRIISGLSDIVCVTEARLKSGSLITVDMALEQNKTVMALPGRVCDGLSQGCNNLIKLGAEVITSPKDVLEALEYEINYEVGENKKNLNSLARPEEMLYSCLDLVPKNVNTIIEETGLTISGVMELLINLEIKGFIREEAPGFYVKTRAIN